MTYTLTVCEGENNERTIRNPSKEAIGRAVDDLVPTMFHFVILEADPPLEKCAYVQTLVEAGGNAKGRYLVEARYKFAEGFKHYRKWVDDAGEVKTMFREFAGGVAPNTAGWDDITEKLNAAAG